MKVQVLVATMNRKEYSFLDDMNLQGEVFVVNQCDRNGYETVQGENYSATIFSTTQRGLSNSRNEALLHVTGDVFLTADDDITYFENVFPVIGQIFEEHPDADIVAFNVNRINPRESNLRKDIKRWRKSSIHKRYGSIRLAYRTASVKRENLSFHPWFGTGNRYHSGEEDLFLRQARKAGLKVYECPETIATLNFSESTWFEGYNERWFHDSGAWVRHAYPKIHSIIKFYYLRYVRHSDLSFFHALQMINQGIKHSKRGIPYGEDK